jgi:beta-lactamase regulating signal transducer with metallopeptidase domain/multidrug resistance efflux pump
MQAFARALIHFVWQGAAIGIVGYALLRSIRLSASARHATGVTLLAVMLAAPVGTTWYFAHETAVSGGSIAASDFASKASPVAAESLVTAPVSSVSSSAPTSSSAASLVNPIAVLVLWLTGVVVLSIRLAGGWIVARRMARRAIQLASPDVQSLARLVAGRLALDRVVRIVESSTVAVPVMVGWIKPVVILPTAALAGLTPLQVEALLAHELAHVCRHDYLVNLLQSVVETALFYHPAVWWLSREVRAAREQCCDDLAVGICDRLVYATALAELAAMAKTPRLALAAVDGSLSTRVRRILGQSAAAGDARVGWIPAALLALLIAGVAPAVWGTAARAADAQSGAQGGVVAGGVGGVATGVPGGVAAGVADGVVAGVPGGVQGGVVTGVPGGVVGGVVGGVSGGVIDGAPQPRQEPAARAQSENVAAAKIDMLAQLLAYARRNLEDARRQVEIGTMAGVDVRDAEATLARLQLEITAQEKKSVGAKSLTEAEAALVNQKFADAVRKLETEEARFAVGLASVRAVDEAVMAALQVATKAAGDQKAANAAADQAAAERAAMTESTLKMLRSQLEDTRLRLERTNELVAQGLAAPADLDQLKILLKNLELKLQAAQQSAETEQKRAAVTKAQFLDYTADVAKLNIEEAQLKLERTQKLVAEGVVSSQAVQEAELAVQRAKYALSLKQIEARPDVALSAPAAALRDRILREGATLSDEALIGVLKDAGKLTGDTDRAEVLLAFARQQTMTPEMATLFVAAAGGIKSDDERARVFKQPVRLRQGKGK